MRRRGFLAGLLAAPVMLKFAGALSPKPIAAVVEAPKVLTFTTLATNQFELGQAIRVNEMKEVFWVTGIENNILTVQRG